MNDLQGEGELIDSSRISVVIQGLTHYVKDDENCTFYQCVHSIRTHLPQAEIIVSTWKNQDCDESVVDRVLYNDEPESITSDEDVSYKWNFNKMVVSTKNGIIASNKEYVLKFRADLFLSGTNFLRITKKENTSETLNQFRIFQTPVNVSNIFTKTPLSYLHFLFHLGDIVQFGRKENLLDLWDRSLLDKNTLKHPLAWWSYYNPFYLTGIRMAPEQALMIGWLNSYGHKINLPYAAHISKQNLYLSEVYLSLNFNVLNWNQTDILYPERFLRNTETLDKYIYQAEEINHLHEKYDQNFLNKRFLYALKNLYLDKWFMKGFRHDLLRIFLSWAVSPEVYSALRTKWRIAKNKKP